MRHNSHARHNLKADTRKINDNALQHTCRTAEHYRDERLESERERLERRLAWAFNRGDKTGAKRIQRRLDQLDDDALTDIEAGCLPGHLERWKRELLP